MAGSLENRGKLRELIDKFKFGELRKSEFIKENIDETIFMFALFKCGKSDKGRN